MGRAYLPEHWVRDPKASFGVKALAGVLATYAQADHGNQDVWPSPTTVAESLGATARHVQNLSAEGEQLGWWTRIHERTRSGGVMLTWRLLFPEFSANGSPTEAQRNYSSVGVPSEKSPTEAQRKPNGSRTEAERNYSSDGRYKGTKEEKVKREELSFVVLTVDHASELVTAYNDLCPSLPKVKAKPGSQAAKTAAAAWKREPDLQAWRDRFARAERSDFLAGRKADWAASFVWICKPANSEKIDSGNYDNRNSRNNETDEDRRQTAEWLKRRKAEAKAQDDYIPF